MVAPDAGLLLADGEHRTFHGAPAQAAVLLESAVAAAAQAGQGTVEAAARWLWGAALSACGRYGQALVALEPLEVDSGAIAGSYASLALSTLASVHRQLGRHRAARDLDEQAARWANSEDQDTAMVAGGTPAFDAALGLAADAVGLGQPAAARAQLDEAAALASRDGGRWRQQVRWGWVCAEVALLVEDATTAVRASSESTRTAENANAPRHVAKSLLFRGVAERQAGCRGAAATLRQAAALATELQALPLVWPANAVLSTVLPDDHAEARGARIAARSAVLAIARDLPDSLAEEWLARPDIVALVDV